MDVFGSFALLLAFVCAAYAIVGGIAAIRTRHPLLIKSARQAGIATGAVGMITDPAQAETTLTSEQADLVFLARQLLRDPYWPRRAAKALDAKIKPPDQYLRAW